MIKSEFHSYSLLIRFKLRFRIKELEIIENEMQRNFREREIFLERNKMKHVQESLWLGTTPNQLGSSYITGRNKVQSAAQLLPAFTDSDAENFLCVFEKTTRSNIWPVSTRVPVLQLKLCGKALEAFSEMNDAGVTDYKHMN